MKNRKTMAMIALAVVCVMLGSGLGMMTRPEAVAEETVRTVVTSPFTEAVTKVYDSVVMPGARVKKGAVVRRAIVAENAVVGENARVGEETGLIAVIGQDAVVPENGVVAAGEQFGDR